MSVYRDILKHSGVYGLGLVLNRVASILLLPLYTSYLTPADYGILAILELTTTIIGHLGAGGLHSAVLREYHEPRYRERRHELWTTGLALLGALAIPLLMTALVARGWLARTVLGDVPAGANYVLLAILSVPAQLFTNYAQAYARAQKRSTLVVSVSLPSLILRIGLNVYLIVVQGLGVYGFLVSSILAGTAEAVALGTALFARRPFGFVREAVGTLWAYGLPLLLTALASLGMHQMDRYLLRWLLADLSAIGIYSVAYTLVQGVNSLLLVPFQSIWAPVIFEVDQQPDRLVVFRRVFRVFVLGLFLVLLGVALAARPLIRVFTAPAYAEAAQVLPWLCLAFLFFPLHTLLRLPAMVHRRTVSVATTSVLAMGINFLTNLALIPRFGIYGAAYASILTYACYTFVGHAIYRRIENVGFPLATVVWVGIGGAALVMAQEAWLGDTASLPAQIASAAIAWIAVVGVALAGPGRDLLRPTSPLRRALRFGKGRASGVEAVRGPAAAESDPGTGRMMEPPGGAG